MASEPWATSAAWYCSAALAVIESYRSRRMTCIAGRPRQVVRTEVTAAANACSPPAGMRASTGPLAAPSWSRAASRAIIGPMSSE